MLYDVQDLWPEAGLAAGAIERGVLYSLMTKCAGFTYRRARHVTVLAPEFKTILAEGGVPPDKISVIPNWTDEGCFSPVPSTGVRAQYGLPEKPFVVMYAGNFGSSHGFSVILEAARLLEVDRDMLFAVSGSGAEYQQSVDLCNTMGLTNVKFLGYVERRTDLPYLYACADLMIVHLRRSPSGAVSLPSRLMAYMACGRPILACCEGAPRNLVERAACGIGCEPENPAAMAAAIVDAKVNRENLPAMGANGRRHYMEHFSEAETLRDLTALIEVLGPRNGRKGAGDRCSA
jgi:glycosyltransferase involved in cell wall biosynthesis